MALRLKPAYELPARSDGLRAIAGRARRKPVTLVYAAKDKDRNNAVVVVEVLARLMRSIRAEKNA
jgi:uncharacterized protein YeaO (DUF488 family)